MLSQFNQTRKKPGDEDEDMDDALDGIGTEDGMDELMDDEDIVDDEGEEEDDLDNDRDASDEVEIEELAYEVEKTHKLSKTQRNHGRFSVTKVRRYLIDLLLI
jgi:hypothetical protein